MKRLIPLLLAVILVLGACNSRTPSQESSLPEEPAESAQPSLPPEESQPEEEKPRSTTLVADGVTQEITGLPPSGDWRLQASTWMEEDRLIAAFSDGEYDMANGQALEIKVILFHLDSGNETTVFTLTDTAIHNITVNESAIQLFSPSTVYAISRFDYSLMSTAPRDQSVSGTSHMSGAYCVEQDDTGLVLRDMTGLNEDVRVATNETDIVYTAGEWSPDGSKFRFGRLNTATTEQEEVLVADRGGSILYTIPLEGHYAAGGGHSRGITWSRDGGYLTDDNGGEIKFYNASTGKLTVSAPLSHGVIDTWGTDALCWKWAEPPYEISILHADRNTSTPLIQSSAQLSASFSPGGRSVVVIPQERPTAIYIFDVR